MAIFKSHPKVHSITTMTWRLKTSLNNVGLCYKKKKFTNTTNKNKPVTLSSVDDYTVVSQQDNSAS